MGGPLLLGIEIGGTKLQLGLGRGDGHLLALERRTVTTANRAEGIRDQILKAMPRLLGDRREGIQAVGIGFGGPVDATRGVVTLSNHIEGWAGFPLVDWAVRALGVPLVALQNDADTAALGEARFGAGVGVSPVLYVQVGSGIGGGLVVNGTIYRGGGLGAVEIGHLLIDDSASLEAVASGWSIGREARERIQGRDGILLDLAGGDPSRINAMMVGQAASAGDPVAIEVLARATTAMGRVLAHAVTLLSPRRVILGGGVSLMGDKLWFDPIREATDRRVFPPFRATYEIVPADLGEEVVIHGALALAADAIEG